MTKRLLISFAHPDDESFGLGSFIGRYVAEGVEVYLLCATNGDVGTVSPEMLNGYSSIAELRLAELECANQILGFKDIHLLRYKDSGMMGSETTQDPQCLWYQWQHNPDDVTRKVVDVIRQVRPHVIITFNEYGGYGHPDHIAIQQATVKAFELAGDVTYKTEHAPYQPQKLYYNRFPTLLLRIGILFMRLTGKDPRKAGVNEDIDLQAILDHVQPATTAIDIAAYREIGQRASACHRSQGGGRMTNNLLLRLLGWWQSRKQLLTRVSPPPERAGIIEHDVFENVMLDEPSMEQLS